MPTHNPQPPAELATNPWSEETKSGVKLISKPRYVIIDSSMKKAALLTVLVLAGIIVSSALLYILILLFYELILATGLFSRSSHYAPFIFISLAIAPLSLMVGSFLTGFLCQPSVKKKATSYLFLSPGLYLAFCYLLCFVLYPLLWKMESSGFEGVVIVSSVIWTISSFFGIYLGFRYRAQKRYKPPPFDLRSNTTES